MANHQDAWGEGESERNRLADFAEGGTCHQFAIADPDVDVPRLLRKVADVIDELGDVDVLDVTFHPEIEGESFSATMSVYFTFGDKDS